MRFIQSIHHTSLLRGSVAEIDIFRECRETAFDVLHFASHAGPEGVQLSGGAIMGPDAIAAAARLRETKGVVFNACEAATLANYAVRHGVLWSLSADGKLAEDDAWRLPASFYGAMRDSNAGDFVGAYILADGGDGMYGLRVNPLYMRDLQRAAAAVAAAIPHTNIPHAGGITRSEAIKLGVVGLVMSSVLSAIVSLLARGW